VLTYLNALSVRRLQPLKSWVSNIDVPNCLARSSHIRLTAAPPRTMPQLTAQRKHDILIHCQSRHAGESEVNIAATHGALVSARTIYNWRRRWNGTPQSLEHKPVSGRPRVLTPAEVSRHVRAPILAANRAHTAVSYTKILPTVRCKTRKQLSLRTLQRTGKEQLNIRSKAAVRRTHDEGQCSTTVMSAAHACWSSTVLTNSYSLCRYL
jgi:hypothetical protein